MRLKRLMAASMAGVMAVSTAIVCQIPASAENTIIKQIDAAIIPVSELTTATKARITFNVSAFANDVYGTITAYVNGGTWKDETFASPLQYEAGAGQSWQAKNKVTSSGVQSCELDFSVAGWGGYEVGIKTDNTDFTAELTTIEFLDSGSNVIATYDANEPSISKDNFEYSVLKNESMAIDDSFTITYDSTNTPPSSQYCIKYVYTDSEGNPQYPYAVKEDGSLDNTSKDIVGVEVSESTNGNKTIYTFTAVSASEYAFKVNVEYSTGGTWGDGDVTYPWFGEVSYKVLPATHTITVDSEITNGTVAVKDDVTEATEGTKITLDVKPDTGYKLKAVTVTKKSGETVEVNTTDYTFAMPDDEVTISAVFEAIAVTGVSLDKTTASLVVDEKETLTATVSPKEVIDSYKTVTWESSDKNVATVVDGVVTAVKAGTATITATSTADNTLSASCTVTVNDKAIPAESVTLDTTEAELEVGETVTIKGTVKPDDSTDKITWTSDNEKVAKVKDGVVTAVAEGKATITATAGGKSDTCVITVIPVQVTEVTLDKTTAELKPEETLTLTATVAPENAADKTVTWTSGDEKVAKVKDGVVTAVAEGTTTITATAGEKTATCTVTVKAAQQATDTALWEGSKELPSGWSENVIIEGKDVSTLGAGTIVVDVEAGTGAQIAVKYTATEWPAVDGLKDYYDVSSNTMKFEVTAEAMKKIGSNNLVIGGQNVTIKKVSFVPAESEGKSETVESGTDANGAIPNTKVTQVNVKTDTNGKVTEMAAYFAISKEDAEKFDKFVVTITRSTDGKKLTVDVEDFYKTVKFTDSDDIESTVTGATSNDYCALLNLKNYDSAKHGTLTITVQGQ